MEDTALIFEMVKCTGMLLFGMKPSHKPLKSVMHGEMFILDYLERKNGPVMPGELSAVMESSSARTAIALRNLEKNGCISRDVDKNDRRKIQVTLTEHGLNLVRKTQEQMLDKMSKIVDELGEDDAKEYIRIVSRIVEITKTI